MTELRLGRSVTELLESESRAIRRAGYRPPPQIVYTPPSKDLDAWPCCDLCGRAMPPDRIVLHYGLGCIRCARCMPDPRAPIPVEDDDQ